MQYAISLHNTESLQYTKLQIWYCCGISIYEHFLHYGAFASVQSINKWCFIYIVGIHTWSQVNVCLYTEC